MADRPSLYLRLVSPGAFLLALGWLIAQLGWPDATPSSWGMAGAGPLVLFAALSAIALAARALASDDEDERARRGDEALLAPCVLAPLAVIAPWVVAPDPLGAALGGLPFFLEWLTRYPSVAGVNPEVLLGLGAVLGACAMPAFFALYVAQARAPRAGVTIAFAALQLVAYVPVLVELDIDLLCYAAIVAIEGPHHWFLLGAAGEGAPWLALSSGAGALLRLFATLSLMAFVVRASARRAPRGIWEMAA